MAKPDADGFVADDDGFVPDDGFVEDPEPIPAGAPAGYVGSVRPDETPQQAAARLGGHYVPPEESGRIAAAQSEAASKAGLAPLRAFGQGFTKNWGDELLAGAKTLGQVALSPSALATIRERLDANRGAEERAAAEATADYPIPYLAGALASPNPLGKAGLLSRLLAGAGWGAVAGAGGSEAGSGRLLEDTARGAGIGAVATGVGEGLGALAGGIGRGAQVRKDALDAYNIRKIEEAVAGDVASAEGKYGSAAQQASRTTENIQRASSGLPLANPGGPSAVDPSLQREALLALTGQTTREVNENVLRNSLERLPKLNAAVQAAKDTWQTVAAAAPGETARRIAEYQGRTILDPLRTWATSQIPRQAFGAAVGGTMYGAGSIFDIDWLKTAGATSYATIAGAPGAYKAIQNVAGSPQALGALSGAAGAAQGLLRQQAGMATTAATRTTPDEAQSQAVQAFLTGG